MKTSQILAVAASTLLASAAPTHHTWDNEANDMIDLIQGKPGKTTCPGTAVIFARGTFDSGNLGVWVGPDFFDSLSKQIPSLALQGVDSDAYSATLEGYLGEHGSNEGSISLAHTVDTFAQCCPDTSIIISGWSQGALVAHKGLSMLQPQTIPSIAGFVTFGDPIHLFSDVPAVSSSIPSKAYCVEGTIFDPLCAELPEDFKFPTEPSDIIGPFGELPHFAQGVEEVEASAWMVVQFPIELLESWGSFIHDLTHFEWARLMLTPAHFMYGNDGMATQAGQWVAGLERVQHPKGM